MKLATIFLFLSCIMHGQNTTINNLLPRLDTEGNIVDAHDGRLIQFGNQFYWYGTAYGNTNGFTTKNEYHCYSSPDLKTWKHEGVLLEEAPVGVYYRPHVIYNEAIAKYVLWYNWYPQLWDGQFGVAISDSPAGPFKIVNEDVKMAHSSIGLGDFGLFVDDDEKAYISYNTIQDHQVSVELLSDDYQSSTLQNGGFIAKHMEAGAMFKREGFYYLVTDYTCCFCNYGSGARVYRSMEPLRGYSFTDNINRYPGSAKPQLTDHLKRNNQTAVLHLKDEMWQSIEILLDEPFEVEDLIVDIFTGNRPENCGDVSNPRVHPEIIVPEFFIEYWKDGEWKELKVNDSEISSSALNENISFEFSPVATSKLRITPQSNEVGNKYFFSEVSIPGMDIQAFVSGPGIPRSPIIPAQQSYIMELKSENGLEYIWIGDLWGSASDNIKGHDYQYWSGPLKFRADGTIKPMKWVDSWEIKIAK